MKKIIYRLSVMIKDYGERKGSVALVGFGLSLMKKAMG